MVKIGKIKILNPQSDDQDEFGKVKMENRPFDDQKWGRQPTTDGQI
jgi:hypothetical protein